MSHLNRAGQPWTPKYVQSISIESCIGCGRCFKVCGHDVLTLAGINEDDEFVEDEDEEVERKVMRVANPGNCIGCEACSRVCSKNAQTHVAAP